MRGGLAPGDVLAGHRIEAVAGQGGMGVVYRATQLALDRTVALKVIAPGLLEDRTTRARFVRESKVAASIDHPNVIPVYYAGEEDGVAYIAMRYVAGDDLRRLVRRERRLPPERAASIVAQVGAALDAAHAAGLVHRDVKPANVLIGPGDHVYLTDFGLSKHALSTAGATKPGRWVGTIDYVAPEQIRGERVDARADVYALGCLLFFTLTGTVPYPRETDEAKLWAQLSDPPPKPSAYGAPKAFDAVVERALAKAPDDRYPSAGDLGRAALAAAAGRQPVRTERVVARGAAAPIEMETVAAHRPAVVPLSADTVAIEASRSRVQRARAPALLSVALFAAAGIGVVTALTVSRRENPSPAVSAALAPTSTPTATATQSPTPTPTPQLRATGSLKVGRRPNVARAAGGKVFVASYRRPRVTVIDAETRKKQAYAPNVGIGTADGAVGGGSVWLAVGASHVVVRLDGRTGRVQRRIPFDGNPGVIAVSGHVLWVTLTKNGNVADTLLKLDLRTGKTVSSVDYPFGIASLTVSPKALWVVSRFRSFTFRADPRTGQPVARVQIGHGPATDSAYGRGYLWVTVPEDDTVYKIRISNAEPTPIAVGHFPRQIELSGNTVYVTDYTSSDIYAIDARSAHPIGKPLELPANPYSIATASDAIWVTSLPEDRITRVVTGRDG